MYCLKILLDFYPGILWILYTDTDYMFQSLLHYNKYSDNYFAPMLKLSPQCNSYKLYFSFPK